MATARFCNGCLKPIPMDAPQGLCPECLVRGGFDTERNPQTAAAATPPEARFIPPTPGELANAFPQLEILELLGQGGMGVVYKARQPQLDRLVALKILPPAASRDPSFAERFTREARALARLNHPNIVSVYDFGQAREFYYFIMEFVDGVNLRQLEQSRRLAPIWRLGRADCRLGRDKSPASAGQRASSSTRLNVAKSVPICFGPLAAWD